MPSYMTSLRNSLLPGNSETPRIWWWLLLGLCCGCGPKPPSGQVDEVVLQRFLTQSYPYPERRFSFRGHRVVYLDHGRGKPLVFLHGQASDLLNFEPVYPLFSGNYRVIALDYPGFGKSDKPRVTWQEPDLVALLDTLYANVDIQSATLIGHSYGGYVAMVYGAARPEKVESMVLVSPAGIRKYPPLQANLLRKAFTTAAILTTPVENALQNYRRSSVNWTDHMARYARRRAGLLKAGEEEYAGYAWAMVQAMELMLQTSVRESIGKQGIPTLLIWGREDSLIPASVAREALTRIPRARLEMLDSCGHFPMLEYPERFYTLVHDFLQERS